MADLPIAEENGQLPVTVNDPVTVTNSTNVTAASTAATAVNHALVVALSPNSPVPTGTNNIGVTGVAQGATIATKIGPLSQASATASVPSYVDGTINPLSMNLVGGLRVIVLTGLVGTLTNNNAAPALGNFGVLPAVANASFPTWTEGDQVLESVDLSGRQRTISILGTTEGKTLVMKTGVLITTAATVDQVILTYTVTAGKTFYIQYVDCVGVQTVPAGGTNILLGVTSLELPSGTKVISTRVLGGGAVQPDGFHFEFSEPIFATSGTVVRIVTTPAAITSFTWQANFGGYER